MTSRGKFVSLIAVLLLRTEPVELSWQKPHPLLNDVVKMFERQTHTAQAVVRVMSPLRNASSEPPILPVVFEASGDVEGNVLRLLHGKLPPSVVVATGTTTLPARHALFAAGRSLPRARHTLLLMGEGAPARLRVCRLLKALRASPLWAAAAQQVVALPDATAQVLREAQRALARSGVVRALGISVTHQPSPTGVRFNPVQRPSRPPPVAHDLRLTTRPVDLRNAPVVFAFVTKDGADEARCMSGDVTTSYSAMDIYISFLIERSKVRAFCFTKAGVMDMPIEFVVKKPGGPTVPPGYDIDVVGVATSLTGSLGLDFLYPHVISHLCLYARRAQPLSFVQSLLRSFSPSTWIATFVVLLTVFVVRMLARDLGGFAIALEVWRTFLTGAFNENRRGVLLAIGLLTSLFSVIVTTAFLSNASSFLSVPPNEAELRTLRDVIRRIKYIYCVGSDVQGYNSSERDEMSILFERLLLQPSQLGIVVGAQRSAFSSDSAILLPDELHFFITHRQEITDGGYTRLRQVDECVVTALPRSYLARKHSQFTEIFENILQRAFQTGILTYIHERKKELSMSQSRLVSASTGPVVYRPYALSLEHLWGALFAWGCGILVSVVTFFLEKCYWALRFKRFTFFRLPLY